MKSKPTVRGRVFAGFVSWALAFSGCSGDGDRASAADTTLDAASGTPETGPSDAGRTADMRPESTGDAAASQGTPDAMPAPRRPMRELLVEIVERRCEHAVRCCGPAGFSFDQDLCREHGADLVAAALDSDAANTADFDRAGANACLAWHDEVGEACDAPMPLECIDTMIGRVDDGDACTWRGECADGSGYAHCAGQNALGIGRCVQFTRGVEGDPCQWTCDNVGDRCQRGIGPGQEEEVSGPFCSRADGLTCAPDTYQCVRMPAEGDDCGDERCRDELMCDPASQKCVRRPTLSEPCPYGVCEDAVCIDGVCAPIPGPGEACDPLNIAPCGPNAECLPDGRCGTTVSTLLRDLCQAYSPLR
jgi:hypothetical protein